MPRGRMLDKRVSDSKKLSMVSDMAKVVYFMLLPHLDKNGAFKAVPGLIKWVAVPNLEYSYKEIEKAINELHSVRLIMVYKVNGDEYLRYTRFREFQTNDINREGRTDIPEPTQELIESYSEPIQEELSTQVEVQGKGKEEGKVEGKEEIEEIVADLNLILQTSYSPKTKKTQENIRARLSEGKTIDDFKTVHRKMIRAWGADAKMVKYLRPETLYSPKFESYLNMKEPTTKLTEAGTKAYLVAQEWLRKGE